MQDLDVEGVFWLEDRPDDTVAGRLTFTGANGAELDLIGSLHDLTTLPQVVISPTRVLGVAGRQLLTLHNAHRSRRRFEMPGIDRETYRIPVVLAGTHISTSEPLLFSSAHMQLENLAAWVGLRGPEVDFVDPADGDLREIKITHRTKPTLTHTSEIGTLEVSFPYHFSSGLKTALEEDASIGVEFSENANIQDILSLCTSIQNLLTIACYATAKVKKVGLEHTDRTRETDPGKIVHDTIDLYTQWQDSRVLTTERQVGQWDMLFTFDDIGGLEGVERWLETSGKFRVTIDYLMTHWYFPALYSETRFLHAVIAAESFERIRTQKKKVNLKRALVRMAHESGLFAELVGDIDRWATEILRTRDKKVVHVGLGPEADGARTLGLSESLYVLVVLCLLREYGVSEKTFVNVKEHDRFKWLAEGLERTA